MAAKKAISLQLSIEFESLSAAQNAIRAFIIEQGESYIISHSDHIRYITARHDTFCEFGIRVVVLQEM